MLPTHAIIMTTYSLQHILHNTCIMDLWKETVVNTEYGSSAGLLVLVVMKMLEADQQQNKSQNHI